MDFCDEINLKSIYSEETWFFAGLYASKTYNSRSMATLILLNWGIATYVLLNVVATYDCKLETSYVAYVVQEKLCI